MNEQMLSTGISAFLGGLVGVVAWQVALAAWWRVRWFLQDRRLQLFNQRQTEILAHRIRNETTEEQRLPTVMDPLQMKRIYLTYPLLPPGFFAEFVEGEGPIKQERETLQPVDDLLVNKGEAGCHA